MAGSCAPTATSERYVQQVLHAPRDGRMEPQQCALFSPRLGSACQLSVSSRYRRRQGPVAAKNAGRFVLDYNSELQVAVNPATDGSVVEVELLATNTGASSLCLHWGALQQGRREWVLPPTRPDGTRTYQDAALRTPFKSVRLF
ncbi:unnamed protein product [Urochloa humidicola]